MTEKCSRPDCVKSASDLVHAHATLLQLAAWLAAPEITSKPPDDLYGFIVDRHPWLYAELHK